MTDPVITVTVPSDSRFVALARLTASGLGAEIDLDVDAIEDLRMAANELVAVVVEWAVDHGHDTVTLTYTLHPDGLDLTAQADGAGDDAADIELDPLTAQILGSVSDTYAVGPGRGSITTIRPTR